MKNLKVFLSLTIMVLLVFTSCSKDEQIFDTQSETKLIQNTDDIKKSLQDLIDDRAKLAKEISCIVSSGDQQLNKVFEKLCYASKEKGHYEQEFFFNLEKDIPQDELNGKTIAQVLIEYNSDNEALLQKLCIYDTGLTLLLIGDANNPNYNSKVYFDNGFDDKSKVAEVPFYENCSMSKTLISNEPSQKSFIVRECETFLNQFERKSSFNQKTISMGSICGNDILCYKSATNSINFEGKTSSFDEILPTTLNALGRIRTSDGPIGTGGGPIGTGGGSGGGGGPEADCDNCERECSNGKENIYKFRARNNYEGAFNGSGEFIFVAVWGEDLTYNNGDVSGGTLGHSLKKRFVEIDDNNTWYYPDFELIDWDPVTDGNRMKYILYEDDGALFNMTVDVDINFGPVNLSTSIEDIFSNNDDFIGEIVVDWCDNLGFEYHPAGDVDVVINQRDM